MANEKRLIDCGKMRSIIRNKILQYIDNQQFVDIMQIFLELLDLCPTVDAVEVVRCRNCKYRHTRPNCAGRPMDFFCADGERK